MGDCLYDANNNWVKRPADQRFGSIREMYTKCKESFDTSFVVGDTCYKDLKVVHGTAEGEDGSSTGGVLKLTRGEGAGLEFSNWAFGQLCKSVETPAAYMRTLPGALVEKCMNHGLQKRGTDIPHLYVTRNGSTKLKAVTSPQYKRISNFSVVEKLSPMIEEKDVSKGGGWEVPTARWNGDHELAHRTATADDIKDYQINIRPGDEISPSGLYASDHDMFVFAVNPNREVHKKLFRGFFVSNSEVGDTSFSLTTFLFNAVCGNHIVWDSQDVKKVRIVHRGNAQNKALQLELTDYANATSANDVERITTAKTTIIGKTVDEVVDVLFAKLKNITKGTLVEAVKCAVEHPEDHDSDPFSKWGVINGITRHSQTIGHTDERVSLDKTAGKLMDFAF